MAKLPCMADLWVFEQLSSDEKKQVESLLRRTSFQKGDYLFREGEAASEVFLITAGRVRLFKVSDDGREVILRYLTVHDLFGEEVLFADTLRAFSAQAVEPTRICRCLKSDFEALIAQNSTISRKVIQTLGKKLNQMAEQLAEAAIYDTRTRVARTLARLAREYGETTRYGRRLNFRLTHEELGALVGASRVMVTNVLKSLENSGIIASDEGEHRFSVSRGLLAETETDEEADVAPPAPPCLCLSKESGS